jgi:outer membrane receptor protein involved in Fe transport
MNMTRERAHAAHQSPLFTLRSTAAAVIALSGSLAGGLAAAQAAADAKTESLETVVITGVRASLTRSLENKRNSDQVVESIVAEDIGKLPDNNVVEALQRVTGIQVTNRAGGEVGTISIRGLPDTGTAATSSPRPARRLRCRTFPRPWFARSTSTRRATPASWKPASPARSTSNHCGPSISRARSSR